ncbi:hypothetical protein B0H14DRAFT_2640738 [Mycena olivaceomarginata]|nr:hypothetical protein B0H14DRAFT_2640738 [Mycena olivaceomarginata]
MGEETEKVHGLYPRPLPIFLNRDAAGAGSDAEADADVDGLGAGAEKRGEEASAPLSAIKGAPAQAEKAALKNDGPHQRIFPHTVMSGDKFSLLFIISYQPVVLPEVVGANPASGSVYEASPRHRRAWFCPKPPVPTQGLADLEEDAEKYRQRKGLDRPYFQGLTVLQALWRLVKLTTGAQEISPFLAGCLQAWLYFRTYLKRDSLGTKALVAWVIVCDTFQQGLITACGSYIAYSNRLEKKN